MRLAMSILVRDEADIIEQNIRFHAAHGVDCFIVTDNSSIDGTREILDKLSIEFDLEIIDEPSLTIDQDVWVTRMALKIKDEGKADWIINNDADEFWITDMGNLREAIKTDLENSVTVNDGIGTIYCNRSNLIPNLRQVSRDDYSFLNNVHRVVGTLTEENKLTSACP